MRATRPPARLAERFEMCRSALPEEAQVSWFGCGDISLSDVLFAAMAACRITAAADTGGGKRTERSERPGPAGSCKVPIRVDFDENGDPGQARASSRALRVLAGSGAGNSGLLHAEEEIEGGRQDCVSCPAGNDAQFNGPGEGHGFPGGATYRRRTGHDAAALRRRANVSVSSTTEANAITPRSGCKNAKTPPAPRSGMAIGLHTGQAMATVATVPATPVLAAPPT